MTDMLKKMVFPLLAAATLLSSGVLHAEVRIGYVHTAKVVEMAPQAASASNKLQAEFSTREAAIVAQQQRLKTLEEKRDRDAAIMSEESRRKMERELLSLQRDIKRAREEFTQDLNLRRNEEFSKLQREVAEAIVTIAKDEKFDLIFESGVVYASDKVDLTNTIIERLKQGAATATKK